MTQDDHLPATTPTVIETARLRLRAYRDDEHADLVAMAGNWEVARWLSHLPHPYSDEDGRAWIAHVRQEHATGRPRSFAIALKDTDRLIGGGGIDGDTGDGGLTLLTVRSFDVAAWVEVLRRNTGRRASSSSWLPCRGCSTGWSPAS